MFLSSEMSLQRPLSISWKNVNEVMGNEMHCPLHATEISTFCSCCPYSNQGCWFPINACVKGHMVPQMIRNYCLGGCPHAVCLLLALLFLFQNKSAPCLYKQKQRTHLDTMGVLVCAGRVVCVACQSLTSCPSIKRWPKIKESVQMGSKTRLCTSLQQFN